MNFITLVFLALAMSTDAFAAAIGKGASLKPPRLINALKMGLIFGVIEGITPIIGWLIGSAGTSYIEAWDHWLAFGLLVALGGHLIYESLDSPQLQHQSEAQSPNKGLIKIVITAVGTSIDALTVGIGLAFLEVNIALAAVMIGIATFTMVTIGSLLGQRLGRLIGKKAEAMGGLVLILIGCWILYSHLSA